MKLKTMLPWAALIGLGALAARRPENLKDRLSQALETASDLAEDVGPRAQRLWDQANPLVSMAGERLGQLWGASSDATSDALTELEDVRAKLRERLEALKPSKKEVKQMQDKLGKEMIARLDRQERQLADLKRQLVAASKPRRRAMGSPLGWVLLGAGALYVARNPTVVDRALDRLGDISPEAQRSAERVRDSVGRGVSRLKRQAKDITENAKDLVDDAVDDVKTAAQDVANKVEEVKADIGEGVQKGKDVAQAVAKDVKRGADTIADHAQNAAESVAAETRAGVKDAQATAKGAARDAKRSIA